MFIFYAGTCYSKLFQKQIIAKSNKSVDSNLLFQIYVFIYTSLPEKIEE